MSDFKLFKGKGGFSHVFAGKSTGLVAVILGRRSVLLQIGNYSTCTTNLLRPHQRMYVKLPVFYRLIMVNYHFHSVSKATALHAVGSQLLFVGRVYTNKYIAHIQKYISINVSEGPT